MSLDQITEAYSRHMDDEMKLSEDKVVFVCKDLGLDLSPEELADLLVSLKSHVGKVDYEPYVKALTTLLETNAVRTATDNVELRDEVWALFNGSTDSPMTFERLRHLSNTLKLEYSDQDIHDMMAVASSTNKISREDLYKVILAANNPRQT